MLHIKQVPAKSWSLVIFVGWASTKPPFHVNFCVNRRSWRAVSCHSWRSIWKIGSHRWLNRFPTEKWRHWSLISVGSLSVSPGSFGPLPLQVHKHERFMHERSKLRWLSLDWNMSGKGQICCNDLLIALLRSVNIVHLIMEYNNEDPKC
jgi:hypothetical protein